VARKKGDFLALHPGGKFERLVRKGKGKLRKKGTWVGGTTVEKKRNKSDHQVRGKRVTVGLACRDVTKKENIILLVCSEVLERAATRNQERRRGERGS